jgi:hypothetical protein
MPGGSVQFPLPNGTQIVVQSFANAEWVQRVTITLNGQPPIVFTGRGYYDTPIGSQVLNTPGGQGGVPTTVAVEHSQDGGQTWQPSQVEMGDCVIQYYQLIAVASEDAGDNTWDDATTYFTWTVPPSSEEVAPGVSSS